MRAFMAVAMTMLALAGGCGYRGPLYLPEEEPAGQSPQPPAEAEEGVTGDEEEEEGPAL